MVLVIHVSLEKVDVSDSSGSIQFTDVYVPLGMHLPRTLNPTLLTPSRNSRAS